MVKINLSAKISDSIIRALIYSDIFHYPLTAEEIHIRLDVECQTLDLVHAELEHLVVGKVIFQFGSFYSVRDDVALALRRESGNKMAGRMMPKAVRRSKLIDTFPFVRAVMVSGSLSKNYFDRNSDIDFFIVTAPNRVWLTRALLGLFQKIVLLNSHKYFCVNYYISSDRLVIDERNIFTATELATLIPICNSIAYDTLLDNNTWLKDFYPQHRRMKMANHGTPFRWFKSSVEWLLSPVADRLDRWAMRRLTARSVRLYGDQLNEADFSVAFKSSEFVSKNHVSNYQKRITDKYHHGVRAFFREMVVS